jgi:hypothetical protein
MTRQHGAVILSAVLLLTISCGPTAAQPKVLQVNAQPPSASTSPVVPPTATQLPTTVSVPVPPEYQGLYDSLSQKLDKFDRNLEAGCKPDRSRKMIYAAELLAASSHVGDRLLNETYYQGVIFWLDTFKSMGVMGVKIAIDYPFFMPDFPNNDAYIKFYKRLVQDCRARNLTVFIANGNLFLNSPFTDLQYNLNGLTLDKYRQGKRQTCEAIIRELHPDYLTVANEPNGAESLNTGITQTPQQFADTTRFILNGLEHSGTIMGSGIGTWSSMSYIEELAKIPELEYIDMHIYPVGYLQGAVDAAKIARANNKRLAFAEVGLYKIRDNEMGDTGKMATQATVYGRDVFGFWEPLDSKFLKVVVKMAKCNGYEFVSPFWSTYLFGYVDYNILTKNLSYNQLRQLDNRNAYTSAASGKLSGWGETYQKLIAADSVTR